MRIGRGGTVGRIHALWPNQVAIGSRCTVMDGVTFDYCHGVPRPGPSIRIGNDAYIGRGVEFNVRQAVTIGDGCLIAAGCRFIDHDHGIASGQLIRLQAGPEAPIRVENDAWLGANVIVLKGVTIGEGAVVAAGAVVTGGVPGNEIWAGAPARRIRSR